MLVGFRLLPSTTLSAAGRVSYRRHSHEPTRQDNRSAADSVRSLRLTGRAPDGRVAAATVTGAPVLERAPAYIECSLVDTIEKGDHSIFMGTVVNAGVHTVPAGRPDDARLTLGASAFGT